MCRKATNRIIEMMDDGILDPASVAEACLAWLSEDDVAEMARVYEWLEEEEEEEEEEEKNA